MSKIKGFDVAYILMWNEPHEIMSRRYGEYHQFKGEPAYARTDATGNPVALAAEEKPHVARRTYDGSASG